MSTSRQADIILMLEWRDMSNVYKWTGGHHPHAGEEGHVQCLQVDRRTSSSSHRNVTCSRHDIAEQIAHVPLNKSHSFTLLL